MLNCRENKSKKWIHNFQRISPFWIALTFPVQMFSYPSPSLNRQLSLYLALDFCCLSILFLLRYLSTLTDDCEFRFFQFWESASYIEWFILIISFTEWFIAVPDFSRWNSMLIVKCIAWLTRDNKLTHNYSYLDLDVHFKQELWSYKNKMTVSQL